MSNKTPADSNRAQVTPYVTRDGSLIRELIHPTIHGNRSQSLAEAEVAVGASTQLHRHRSSEEIYYVIAGAGTMDLGNRSFPIQPGDSVIIQPGTPHRVHNTGTVPLRFLCCCAPPYAHDDTELMDER